MAARQKRGKVTTTDIATRLGISQASVSRALHGKGVSPAMIQRVREAAVELGYLTRDQVAQLATRSHGFLALLVPDGTNPFFSDVMVTFQRVATQSSKHVVVAPFQHSMDEFRRYMDYFTRRRRADGLVIYPMHDPAVTEVIAAASGESAPIVLMGSSLLPLVHTIDADFASAGREMGLHLIQQGHRRIGFIHALYLGACGGLGQADGRLLGLRHALAESGLPWDEDKYLVQCETTMLDGYQAALRLLRQDEPPTAIFAINDFMALGVLQAAAEAGLRVPQDLSVAGFDNVSIAQPFGLTTADPRLDEVAQAAISMIVDAVGRRHPAGHPQARSFTPRLIIRKTTGPAPA